jgi:hypothetical protein
VYSQPQQPQPFPFRWKHRAGRKVFEPQLKRPASFNPTIPRRALSSMQLKCTLTLAGKQSPNSCSTRNTHTTNTCTKRYLFRLWGKLAQRANTVCISLTSSAEEFHDLVERSDIEVLDVEHINAHLDRVVHRSLAELQRPPRTNNIPVACYVTSHARLHLYSYMRRLQPEQLLYCDTDSMIYVRKIGQPDTVPQGNRLGEMAREYSGHRITHFISAGPKNYALRMYDRQTGRRTDMVKIRGFRLTYNARRSITFSRISRLIHRKIR